MTLNNMNKIANKISAQRLIEAVEYNGSTGTFTWRKRPDWHFRNKALAARWNGKYQGKPAFTSKCPRGYLRGALDQSTLYAHRAAIAVVMGDWPDGEIDHINRDKSDNRISNLRVVTHSENRRNTPDVDAADARRDASRAAKSEMMKKCPVPGVRKASKTTWSVRVKRAGYEVHVGSFRCFGAAVRARALA